MRHKIRLQWRNLFERGKCPKCNTLLTYNDIAEFYVCPKEKCSFRIGPEKYEDILQSIAEYKNSRGHNRRRSGGLVKLIQ